MQVETYSHITKPLTHLIENTRVVRNNLILGIKYLVSNYFNSVSAFYQVSANGQPLETLIYKLMNILQYYQATVFKESKFDNYVYIISSCRVQLSSTSIVLVL